MARQRGAAAAGQQPEPVVEAVGDLRRGHRAQAGGGQLDGQRHAVQAAADRQRRVGVGGHAETRANGGAAFVQQAHRRVAERPVVVGAGRRLVRRDGERRHLAERLAGDAERFAAGGQHPHAGALGEHPVDDGGARVDEVLAVVQHDQRAFAGERGDKAVERVCGGGRAAAHGRHQGGVAQAEGAQQRVRDLGRVADGGQFHQPDAAGHAVGEAFGGLDRQPGLAGAARPGQGHQAVLLQQLADPLDLLLAADEAGQPGAQVAGPAGGRGTADLAAQHGQVHGLQLRRRVDAELLGEEAPGLVVGGERVGTPTGGAQHPHVLAAQPFAQRMRGDQGLDLGRVGTAQREPGLDVVLDGAEALLGEPEHVLAGEGRVGDVGEGGAAPQVECPAEQAGGAGGIGSEDGAPLRHEPLEPRDVDRVGRDVEAVAGRMRLDRRAGQRAAQPGDQRLQRVRRPGRRRVAPQAVREAVAGDDPAGLQRQHDQQRAQPGPADLDRPAGVIGHREGT